MIIAKTFQDAFVDIISYIIENPDDLYDCRDNQQMYEVLSLHYRVDDPTTFKFENENIGRIPYEYASDFYDWMVGGSTWEDTEVFKKKYPNVARFLERPKSEHLPENFNVFYGARIKEQLPAVEKELREKENSRRAVINILNADDLKLLDAAADSNLEYPCADSATFSIRNGKLHLHLHMRSNNMANVAKLDMYLWGRFQCEFAEKLEVEIGRFDCTIVSAHVFTNDIEYLKSINIVKSC